MTETPTPDPLEALRERIRRTQEAAEELAREATRQRGEAGAEGGTAGERATAAAGGPAGAGRGDASVADMPAVEALVDLLRGLIPPELRAQLIELVRQLLLAIRALIDWYLERLAARRAAEPEVEEIPIS